MIKLIIFDWDDVFTPGSKEGYFACYNDVIKKLNIRINPNEARKRILSKWGQGHRESLTALLKENPELIDKASIIYEENLFANTYISKLTVIKGVQLFLKKLSKSYALALVTGIHPSILKIVMKKFNIPNLFKEIITFFDLEDPEKGKPHPFSIEEILRRTGFNKKETIFVGDAVNDVKTAKNAGVIPIVVLTGHLTRKEAEELGVKYIIPDVTHLEKVLQQL